MAKKLISLVLAATLLLSVPLVAFGATAHNEATCTNVPIIWMDGAFHDLYLYEGTDQQIVASSGEGSDVFAELGAKAATIVAEALAGSGKTFASIVNKLFGAIAFNKDGTSANPGITRTSGEKKPSNASQLANTDHTKNRNYYWHYDWRQSPLDLAVTFHDFVQQVKEKTGHSKVNVRTVSGSSTILMSYFYLYPEEEDFASVLIVNSLHNGSGIFSQVFNRKVMIDNDALGNTNMFSTWEIDDSLLKPLLKLLWDSGVLRIISTVGNALVIKRIINDVFEEGITPTLLTLPMSWAFCADDGYESAKQINFKGDPSWDKLVSIIDDYHYNVQQHSDELIKTAIANGVRVGILSTYGSPGTPFVEDASASGDSVVEAALSSAGATVAPYGKQLGKLGGLIYTQAIDDGHNHLSSDGCVDASTCLLPEQTWFMCGASHTQGFDSAVAFGEWFFDSKTTPSVFSNEDYPQYLTQSADRSVVYPYTPTAGRSGIAGLLQGMFETVLHFFRFWLTLGTLWLGLFD